MTANEWRGAKIVVIGVGGAGSNAVDRMIQIGIPGVDFVVANTDLQALARSEAPVKIYLEGRTRALGAGGNPDVGAEAAQESRTAIARALHGADMVFITAGMGGGTGTGAAPIVAQVARAEHALTIAIVTRPFSFEGRRRQAVAEEGIVRLREEVDALLVVPNDRLIDLVNQRVSLEVAFRIADEVLRQAVQGIADLATRPGLINLDFADIRAIMQDAGQVYVSIGYGEGEHKAVEAAHMALQNPLLNAEMISGMERVLVNITGGDDLTLTDVNQAMEMIRQAAVQESEVFFGAVVDPRMSGRVEITLIASGLGREARPVIPKPEPSPLAVEVAPDDLSVPAFMRRPRRVIHLEEVKVE
jgi:cell division protein FtsZ